MTHLIMHGETTQRSLCSVSVRILWPFVKLAPQRERGALIARLSAELGLNQAQFEASETRVSLQTAIDLLSVAASRRGLRNIGLVAARRITSEHLSLLEYLARTKGNFGEALKTMARCMRLLVDGAHLSLNVEYDQACLRLWFDSDLVIHEASYEFAVATLLNAARRITRKPELAPIEVHFMYAQPRDLTVLRRQLNCKLRFDMPVTQIVWPAKTLAIPLIGAEPTLARFLEQQAHASLAHLPSHDDFVKRVRDLLSAEINLCGITAAWMARRLGVSVRTLARRLRHEKTSFRLLLDDQRKALALRDLAQTLRPINEIAAQLGFSNRQSFHRAFRRWTGTTAMTYRETARRLRFGRSVQDDRVAGKVGVQNG